MVIVVIHRSTTNYTKISSFKQYTFFFFKSHSFCRIRAQLSCTVCTSLAKGRSQSTRLRKGLLTHEPLPRLYAGLAGVRSCGLLTEALFPHWLEATLILCLVDSSNMAAWSLKPERPCAWKSQSSVTAQVGVFAVPLRLDNCCPWREPTAGLSLLCVSGPSSVSPLVLYRVGYDTPAGSLLKALFLFLFSLHLSFKQRSVSELRDLVYFSVFSIISS